MITVSDYIVKYLEDIGVEQVFSVVGGGSMFLNNSFGNSKKIKVKYFHHEQACAIAAEGYSRANNYKLAIVCVTTGPGGLNCLTGVMGQWTDSVPVLYLSGQVKYETTIQDSGLRQLGDQEVDIVNVVHPLTSYWKLVEQPNEIKYELETAIALASNYRKSPVWLDIPINVQNAKIEEETLRSSPFKNDCYEYEDKINDFIEFLYKSEKPLIVAGHGIKIANAQKEFKELISKLNIPVVTTFNGFDLLSGKNKNWVGRIGTLGSRAGNFVLQNADLIIELGTRNNIRQVSYNWKNFARNAKKIIIDIDAKELKKKIVEGDLIIHSDVKKVINYLLSLQPYTIYGKNKWLNFCLSLKNKYPLVEQIHYENKTNGINPYIFINELTKQLSEDSIVVCGNGTACVSYFQAGIVKENQRVIWNSGCASMGYALPAAIGACFANPDKNIICIDGDGSFQMNIQELSTIQHYNLPIKIFLLNNKGYQSIKQTQTNFFGKEHLTGCDDKDLSFPDYKKLADVYRLKYFKIDKNDFSIDEILQIKNSCLCEVDLTTDYIFAPKLSSKQLEDGTLISPSLEDMFPFLPEKEIKENIYG